MNEEIPATLPAKNAGANPATESVPPVVRSTALGSTETVVAPKSSSSNLFGGHKGGGKKRGDGLIAGSPEAIEADKEKNRLRMREKRAAEKMATAHAPLPGVPVSPEKTIAPLAGDPSGVLDSASGFVEQPILDAAPTWVAWTVGALLRPIKLLTKIVDRVRCSSLMQRVKKLRFTPDQEKQAEEKIKFKQEAVADFNNSLANCLAIELNKRRAPGAQHSHWLDVAISGGELLSSHLDTVDWLEKTIAENAAREVAVKN